MPPSTQQNVLIVGAGPTGLTAACELARRGINFKIIDKAASPSQQSRALAVHARTLELLDDMDIAKAMIAEGLVVERFEIFDLDKRLAVLDLNELKSPFPFLLVLPQSATEHHLRAYLEQHGQFVRQQTELVGLHADRQPVSVTLKAADGSQSQESFDWVIACDGAHSAVRHLLNLPFEGGTISEQFILADVQIDAAPAWQPQPPMAVYTGKQMSLAIFQINQNLFRIIGILPPNAALSDTDTPLLTDVQKIVDLYRADLKLHSPSWLAAFRVSYRRVDRYRAGRVFVAGDAAHIHSPAGGQGMNTGMQDAANLAWKLALVIQEGAREQLLDSYQAERLPVAKAVLAGTNFITRANLLRSPISKQIRRHVAPILLSDKRVQKRIAEFIGELSVAYRASPIVFQRDSSLLAVAGHSASQPDKPGFKEWFEFSKGPQPGERAQDAEAIDIKTKTSIRLFETFKGTRHTLLLLIGQRSPHTVLTELSPLAHAVEQKFGRLVHTVIVNTQIEPPEFLSRLEAHVLFDSGLSIHKRYGAGSACVYLIRPDGYVGYRGQPPELSDIEYYFRHWLGIEVE